MATKSQEIKNKGKDELMIMLREKRAGLVSDRFNASARQLKSTNKIKQAKREIARIMTVLKQQQEKQAEAKSDK